MDFVKGKLDASHKRHDTFIYEYVKKVEWPDGEDVVLEALRAELLVRPKTNLRTWVKRRLRRGPDNDPLSFHRMALYIMLTQYSTQWPGMFEATYNLLMGMLFHIIGSKYLIFPPKWTRQVFRLENCLSPAEINGVMWGIDPLSSSSGYGKYATGYAFTFAVPDENDLTTEASSSEGLRDVYGLDISLYQDKTVEESFVKYYGIGLVNFIRTIEENSGAGSRNTFRFNWIPYNLEWLKVLNINLKDKVMVFQNFRYPFNNYCFKNSDFEDLKTLISEKRWPHPSYIKKDEKMDHCLKSPVVSCYSTCGACKPKRCNARVNGFVLFLEVLEAGYAVRCGGNNCNCTATRTALEEILFCHFTSDFY